MITDPLYVPPKEVMDIAIKAGVQIIKKNRDLKEEAVKMFPNMKRQDLELMGELITEEDIKDYERESGN